MDSVARSTLQRQMVESIHAFNKDLSRVCCLSGTVFASENTEMSTTNKISVPVENQLLSHSLHLYLLIQYSKPWAGVAGGFLALPAPASSSYLAWRLCWPPHGPPPSSLWRKNMELFLSFNNHTEVQELTIVISFFFFKKYLLLWLCKVLVAACVGSSSLRRDQIQAPYIGSVSLSTEPPGKS